MGNPVVGERIRMRRKELGMTLDDIAGEIGVAKSTIQRYETGTIEKLKLPVIEAIARVLRVAPEWLVGKSDNMLRDETPKRSATIPPGFDPPPKTHKVPLLGSIACGEPITAEENLEGYVDAPDIVHCDFALRCEGDSMIDAGISEGDVVFIRKQPEVPNGQIAAVRIGDEATLKRVYWDGTTLTLIPENRSYAPRLYTGEALRDVQIEGRAVGYLHLY